jgi:hypothetical protein
VAAGRGRSRRVSIPGVAELLRPATTDPVTSDERQATGRERHDQKITVYLSAAELLDLEHARLALRRFGFVVDRGRLVREAIAILLADLDARGKDSVVARRVRAGVNGKSVDENGFTANGMAGNGVGVNGPVGSGPDGGPAADDGQSAGAPSPLPSLVWRGLRAAR